MKKYTLQKTNHYTHKVVISLIETYNMPMSFTVYRQSNEDTMHDKLQYRGRNENNLFSLREVIEYCLLTVTLKNTTYCISREKFKK
jgi:hypothetical protein